MQLLLSMNVSHSNEVYFLFQVISLARSHAYISRCLILLGAYLVLHQSLEILVLPKGESMEHGQT